MRQRKVRGGAAIEFAFVLLVLIPCCWGRSGGVNLVRTLQTVQLARDAEHMYARGLDFSPAGQQDDLVIGGRSLGLTTTPAPPRPW